MSPIDHITIPCAASKVDAEVAFFIKAFAHMGVKEVMRPFPDYVGLGDTSPWLWISGLNEKFEPIADDVHIQSMHVAVTAKGMYSCSLPSSLWPIICFLARSSY